ncbi:hypothetical protein IKQ74_01780 [Candidatus Saccharibacteria bacterium]|nr:hypothetical protein [Candidatus Saccharibacteria bacterium]
MGRIIRDGPPIRQFACGLEPAFYADPLLVSIVPRKNDEERFFIRVLFCILDYYTGPAMTCTWVRIVLALVIDPVFQTNVGSLDFVEILLVRLVGCLGMIFKVVGRGVRLLFRLDTLDCLLRE